MSTLKKCYYEVLAVERDATDEDIKKSFRKLALQLHPDKNLHRGEEAKVEFQVLQQAYGVLSNPQERAWYDEHRHAILRGGLNVDFADDTIDIIPYCTSSCYKGFGDDEQGFYTVYRKLFEKIAAEEVEAGLENSDEEIPSFGDSMASYDEDVGPFYAFWESFCTRKNFAWFDEYDTRHAGCRRVSRLMDKENKKLRSEAKKDWNQRVRALVDFVKCKDKRVQAWKVEQEFKLKEREAELAKKFAEEKARRLEERKKMLESVKRKDHPLNSTDKQQLKEMEDWMATEFGDKGDTDSSEEDCLYCEVCNKSFRTEKSFMNHEKSKKHLQQVQLLKEMMEEEDQQFAGDDEGDNGESEGDSDKAGEEGVDQSDARQEVIDRPDEDSQFNSQNEHDSPAVEDFEHKESDEEIEDEDERVLLQNFAKIKVEKILSSKDKAYHVLPNDQSEGDIKLSASVAEAKEQTKKKRRRAPKGTKVSNDDSSVPQNEVSKEPQTFCLKCEKKFENKNQLFKHLKQYPSHAALKQAIDSNSFDQFSASKGKKGKRK